MPSFLPGLELSRKFYFEAVAPLLNEHFPRLRYSAALTGHGSDVLGFDTAKSTDHNWGPRCLIFLPERGFAKLSRRVSRMLAYKLPLRFLGFPTNFAEPQDSYLRQPMQPKTRRPVNHGVEFFTIRGFYQSFLDFDPRRRPGPADWLTFPQQMLLQATAGQVFYDGLGGLEPAREKFRYYPRDVWLYLLQVQWQKIANEQQFQARSGEEGDELGSHIVAGRSVYNVMQLCFLMERRYAPYAKWFGSAFLRLRLAGVFTPLLQRILHCGDWRRRQLLLAKAHLLLGQAHNGLKLTKKLPLRITDFYGRDYPVFDVRPFTAALRSAVASRRLREMEFQFGGVDQFLDGTLINQHNYVYLHVGKFMKKLIDA